MITTITNIFIESYSLISCAYFGKITKDSYLIDENSFETLLKIGPSGPIWDQIWPIAAIFGGTHSSIGTVQSHETHEVLLTNMKAR